MPTNLPPQYFEAQSRYRAARTTAEKIACVQEMLSIIPKHKGTEHLVGDLRRRLSKLKAAAAQTRKTVGKRETAFTIDKAGAGQVVVVGPPNVGKSALVAALTPATPEVADYAFTTREPTPGMMQMENVQIQLIDTPPLSREYVEPELWQLIRRADLILVVVNLETDPVHQLENTVAMLEEYRIAPAQWRERYSPEERGIAFKPFLVLANKYDDEEADELYEIFCHLIEGDWALLPVSATTGRNLDHLRRAIFERLEILRVYSKGPGQEPDMNAPITMPIGSTVEDFAGKIHKDFIENLKLARVWGDSVFDGQAVGRDYVLQDGDVIELHT